ncbi:hypothetical protein [Mycetocola saprophilus]|uniref:hypothetical protein n=1 Tax=Mycetocola saprophilus TaxID=76636 RepID=UPI0012DFE626|nr:hypothetical protein [Mycetocola saprophilus]
MTQTPAEESPRRAENDDALDVLTARVRELEHERLRLRDQLIGSQQELEALRTRVGDGDAAQAALNAQGAWERVEALEGELNTLRHESDVRLREQEQAFRASRTWRVGHAVLRPLSLLRGSRSAG